MAASYRNEKFLFVFIILLQTKEKTLIEKAKLAKASDAKLKGL
jgi:hypothetical protein